MKTHNQWRRHRGGLGGYPPAFENSDWIFSHFEICCLPFRGLLPKVEKVIFSYFGAKVTGKSSWKTRMKSKKRSSVGTSLENLGQKIENCPKRVMDIRWSKHFRPFSHFDLSPSPAFTCSRRHCSQLTLTNCFFLCWYTSDFSGICIVKFSKIIIIINRKSNNKKRKKLNTYMCTADCNTKQWRLQWIYIYSL